jgi:hypothetical protein
VGDPGPAASAEAPRVEGGANPPTARASQPTAVTSGSVAEAVPTYRAVVGFVPPEKSSGDNFLLNPSFEEGVAPWFVIESPNWRPFHLGDKPVHTGSRAACVELRPVEGRRVCIRGLVQDLEPTEFPRRLGLEYFVKDWNQGWPKQYVQVAVVVHPNRGQRRGLPEELKSMPSLQMRYILAGADRAPISVANARFVVVGETKPQTGEWIHMERDLIKDFETHWGFTPSTPNRIRVLCEVRYDLVADFSLPIVGDVCFDDVYLGR